MEWPVGSLNNEASHGLCLSKVELHGFASNGTVLLRLNALIHPPSGDNSLFASNGAWVIRTVAVGSPSPLISLLNVAHSWSEILFTGHACDDVEIGWRERFDLKHHYSGGVRRPEESNPHWLDNGAHKHRFP